MIEHGGSCSGHESGVVPSPPGSDVDRFRSRNPGPLLGGVREGLRVRAVEQARRPRRCGGPEGITLRQAGTSVLIQDATSDE